MTDRELLENAAKAAGVCPDKSVNHGFDILGNVVLDWHNAIIWNPLANDCDALRLAITLNLPIIPHTHGIGWIDVRHTKELCGSDPMAATRRAIVRAAASLAELPEGLKL